MSSPPRVPGLQIPHRVQLRRALRCLRVHRLSEGRRGGPIRDQLLLRALDALAAAGQLRERTGRVRRGLAQALTAAGLERRPVFSRPRSMWRE